LHMETVAKAWQEITKRIFPKGTEKGSITHLTREAKELLEEVEMEETFAPWQVALNRKRKTLEYADCFACLFTAMKQAGISTAEVTEALLEKAMINGFDREWNDNGDGSYSHIKTEEEQ
jgi:hypothetical protein